jgi:amino acid transporter
MESIAMAAAEVQNPRRALPKAVKRVFYRILAFYVFAILIMGALEQTRVAQNHSIIY